MGPQSTLATAAGSLPKVLLLANDLASAHTVREGICRAGLALILETVGSRSEFLLRLRSGSVDLVLAVASGLRELPASEIACHAQKRGAPVRLILIAFPGEMRQVLSNLITNTIEPTRVKAG